ncbi:MAG: NADPH-dependent 7-cyano-7-deazaguanine reductase QueF [Acidimicrobiales bacterium]|nr:MAG: NADPH-dependent 7-cyano-7-deazaguanine reductase QueF [Acidimicrobiales bacterium]
MPSQPSTDLVALPNPSPDREYEVTCSTPELTCVCPRTAQPDFATVTITYVPGPSIVELKSLKGYLWSYRDQGAYHEAVTNRILDDLVAAIDPVRMTVRTDWLIRGGIHTVVEARHCPAGAAGALAGRNMKEVPPKAGPCL